MDRASLRHSPASCSPGEWFFRRGHRKRVPVLRHTTRLTEIIDQVVPAHHRDPSMFRSAQRNSRRLPSSDVLPACSTSVHPFYRFRNQPVTGWQPARNSQMRTPVVQARGHSHSHGHGRTNRPVTPPIHPIPANPYDIDRHQDDLRLAQLPIRHKGKLGRYRAIRFWVNLVRDWAGRLHEKSPWVTMVIDCYSI